MRSLARSVAGGRDDPAARGVKGPVGRGSIPADGRGIPVASGDILISRPPIVCYSPELRPLIAVAMGCHGNPDRCLVIAGWRMPICARCTGFVGGNLLGLAILLAVGPASWSWALAGLALLVPVAVDGSRQISGRYRSTNPRRLATGLLGGIGQIAIIGAFLTALTPRLIDRLT